MADQLTMPFDDGGGKNKKRKRTVLSVHFVIWDHVKRWKEQNIRPTLKEALNEASESVGRRVDARSLRAVMNEMEIDIDSFFRQTSPDPSQQTPMSTLHLRVTSMLGRVDKLEADVKVPMVAVNNMANRLLDQGKLP